MKKFICLFTGVLFLAGWVQVSVGAGGKIHR